jgi:ERCC4-related helicase
MLGEESPAYHKVLYMKMQQLRLSESQIEQLAGAALQRSKEAPPPGEGAHSAGRWFGAKLDERRRALERSSALNASVAAEPKVARAYQEELADKVGSGNAIVVCTTGSGKTLVSALVIERALSDKSRDGIVVYLEKIRHLVKQQKRALDEFFRPRGCPLDYIGEYVGGDPFIPHWSTMVQRHSIVVMTVDLFLARLLSGEAKLDQVRLVVFDECHSTSGAHSYNRVNIEMRRRAEDGSTPPPQILGMTATPSWKDTVAENITALAQLCKNMNNAALIQVEDNLQSLREHVHEPQDFRHPLRLRDDDEAYKRELLPVMEMVECALGEYQFGYDATTTGAMREAAGDLRSIRQAPNAPTGFSKNYEKAIKTWQGSPELGSCLLAKVLLQLLLSMNTADVVTEEVGFESAQCLLGSALFKCVEWATAAESDEGLICKEVIKQVLESRLCSERFVLPLLDAHPHSSIATARNCSPKLSKLVECLSPPDQCGSGSERPLKAIVFVQTRASAHRVVNFIQTHPHLKTFVRPAVFCGHAEMSSRAQEQAAEAFKLGRYNTLVATSVAEEGLDAPDMQTAVMLDGVTSGRAREQVRGRVMRTPGGKFHILYIQGSREDVGVWRATQQAQSARDALEEVAAHGVGSAFAKIAIGPNPLVSLENLKGKGKVKGLHIEVSEYSVDGRFTATARLTVVETDRTFEYSEAKPSKKAAKQAAAESLLNALLAGS